MEIERAPGERREALRPGVKNTQHINGRPADARTPEALRIVLPGVENFRQEREKRPIQPHLNLSVRRKLES